MKLIECVPNFSEGCTRAVIDAIAAEISGTEGAVLLDVDAGAATNRTVMTFAGPPEAVEEAAFRAMRKAAELIDMSRHRGEHPRMGAADVCPFVPMQGASMADCVELSHRLGRRVGEELGIPVYLYGQAATRPERRLLPDIRQGEYEALREKLGRPEFAPDYGPARFDPKSGATAIGAREFLIAWNVNLNTRDRKLAGNIAAELRETGKPKRDAAGETVRNPDGSVERSPGRFRELQAGGWYIAEYGRAQVTCNLTNPKVTPLHDVFDACCEEAAKLGLRVTGSEIVGLVPLEAVLAAGDHYLTRQGRTTGVPEPERVHTALLSLGLGDLTPFDPEQKILEYRYRGKPAGLRSMTLERFVAELSSDSAAPGGGSAAALCGALSAALSSMVAAVSFSSKDLAALRPTLREIGERAQTLKDRFLEAAELDAAAFHAVLDARRLPRGTPEQQVSRLAAIERASQQAIRVPLGVLERSLEALELARRALGSGNPNVISDAGTAGAAAAAAAEGAALNVRINLPLLTDENAARELGSTGERLLDRARELAEQVREAAAAALGAR